MLLRLHENLFFVYTFYIYTYFIIINDHIMIGLTSISLFFNCDVWKMAINTDYQ